jgi:hypothetical protein
MLKRLIALLIVVPYVAFCAARDACLEIVRG